MLASGDAGRHRGSEQSSRARDRPRCRTQTSDCLRDHSPVRWPRGVAGGVELVAEFDAVPEPQRRPFLHGDLWPEPALHRAPRAHRRCTSRWMSTPRNAPVSYAAAARRSRRRDRQARRLPARARGSTIPGLVRETPRRHHLAQPLRGPSSTRTTTSTSSAAGDSGTSASTVRA